MANQKEPFPYAGRQGERLMSQSERLERELPEAVKTLVEARTGDAVYVVGPDYSIVHWDDGVPERGASPRARMPGR